MRQSVLDGPGWMGLCVSVDFVLTAVAMLLAMRWSPGGVQLSSSSYTVVALPVFVVLLLAARGLYRNRLRVLILDWLPSVVSAVSVATMAAAMLDLLINGQITDEAVWVKAWVLTLLLVSSGRALVALAHRRARARRIVTKPALIVGAGVVGRRVAARLEAHPEYGLSPVGFVDDDPLAAAAVGTTVLPLIGSLESVRDAISRTGARTVIVAFSSTADARVSSVVRDCQDLGVEVAVVPRMFDTINNRITYEAVGGLPLLFFTRIDPKGWQFELKHVVDRLLAAVVLTVLAPLLAAIALAVRVTSSGPILFRQRRVGRDGKVFDLYKFRSMQWRPATAAHSEDFVAYRLVKEDVGPGGLEHDTRLTPIGGLLRRLSLDELPQFINVLKGDMSVIGPRPERPEFADLFARDIERYGDRHRVKSGITGWAQVHGLRGPTSLVDRTEWDNYYIEHWSPGLDIRILVLTARELFGGS